jgi:hypothetical protein
MSYGVVAGHGGGGRRSIGAGESGNVSRTDDTVEKHLGDQGERRERGERREEEEERKRRRKKKVDADSRAVS